MKKRPPVPGGLFHTVLRQTQEGVFGPPRSLLVQLHGLLHGHRAGQVAQDVAAGGAHVAEGVDADVHAHHAAGQSGDGGQRCKGGDGAAGDARGADAEQGVAQQHDHHHAEAHLYAAGVGKEDDHEGHEDGHGVHVDGGTQGQGE